MTNFEKENKTDLFYRGRGVGINETIIGKCSICSGNVTIPMIFHSIVQPEPTCIKCGAVKANDIPTIKMKPAK